jgi:hypothetical protein
MNETDISAQIRLRDYHVAAVKELAKHIPNLRTHALTDAHWQSLAELHKSIADRSGSPDLGELGSGLDEIFVTAVGRYGKRTPRFLRDELIEPTVPVAPLDIRTNQPIPLSQNHSQRALMAKNYPEYYEFELARDKNPLQALLDFNEKKALYAQKKEFYSSFDPRQNPFATGDLTAQGEVVKLDPIRAQLLEEESLPSASLPFGATPNQTILSRIAEESPVLGELAVAANKVAKQWANLEERASAEELKNLALKLNAGGYQIFAPGQTQDNRRANQRRPQKGLAPLGSAAQEKLQKEAALAAVEKQ